MSKTIDLIATQSFEFNGRVFAPGQAFAVTPIEAAALTYQKKATFAPKAALLTRRDLQPEPLEPDPPPAPTRRRRQYRRRDLKADE